MCSLTTNIWVFLIHTMSAVYILLCPVLLQNWYNKNCDTADLLFYLNLIICCCCPGSIIFRIYKSIRVKHELHCLQLKTCVTAVIALICFICVSSPCWFQFCLFSFLSIRLSWLLLGTSFLVIYFDLTQTILTAFTLNDGILLPIPKTSTKSWDWPLEAWLVVYKSFRLTSPPPLCLTCFCLPLAFMHSEWEPCH